VKPAELLHQVNPEYPKLARAQRVEGTVSLNVTIGADGVVHSVTVLSGPLLLTRAAEEAVRQWRYSPTLLDGKPVEVQKEVDLRFHFTDAPR
jgi:protein TonB